MLSLAKALMQEFLDPNRDTRTRARQARTTSALQGIRIAFLMMNAKARSSSRTPSLVAPPRAVGKENPEVVSVAGEYAPREVLTAQE